MQLLSNEQRQVVLLRYFAGLSLAETAGRLRTAAGYSKIANFSGRWNY